MVIHGDLADVSSLTLIRADIMLSLVRPHNLNVSRKPFILFVWFVGLPNTTYWSSEFLIFFHVFPHSSVSPRV